MEGKTPQAYVDTVEYVELAKKLQKIEEKIEFFQAELAQQTGKKVGRDIGILYGLVFGLFLVLVYLIIKISWG
ncbi:MAG: tetrahydromethanopterin S-methyltransferase subunit G [Archaeoglobales archaeon]|nr:tetrahydromethanopterin S-methyltransferase subunit G [Archaeoglobales archaeon]